MNIDQFKKLLEIEIRSFYDLNKNEILDRFRSTKIACKYIERPYFIMSGFGLFKYDVAKDKVVCYTFPYCGKPVATKSGMVVYDDFILTIELQ